MEQLEIELAARLAMLQDILGRRELESEDDADAFLREAQQLEVIKWPEMLQSASHADLNDGFRWTYGCIVRCENCWMQLDHVARDKQLLDGRRLLVDQIRDDEHLVEASWTYFLSTPEFIHAPWPWMLTLHVMLLFLYYESMVISQHPFIAQNGETIVTRGIPQRALKHGVQDFTEALQLNEKRTEMGQFAYIVGEMVRQAKQQVHGFDAIWDECLEAVQQRD